MLLIAAVIIIIVATVVMCVRCGEGDSMLNGIIITTSFLLIVMLVGLAFLFTASFPASVSKTVTTTQHVTAAEMTTKLVQSGKIFISKKAVIIVTEEEGQSGKLTASTIEFVDSAENIFVTTQTPTKNLFISPFSSTKTTNTLYWDFAK